jgi:hypothetical protein
MRWLYRPTIIRRRVFDVRKIKAEFRHIMDLEESIKRIMASHEANASRVANGREGICP